MPDLVYKHLNLHYSDTGHGETMLLIHGFLEELSMWKRVTAYFEPNFRVVSLDLLGHGKTGNLGYIHSMEAQAEMVKFLLDELQISKCIVIGHSMGGYVALALADLFPEMVSGLCLMNSSSREDSPEKKTNRDRGIKAVKQNHRTFIKMAIPNLFSADNRDVFPAKIKEITREALNMGPQGIIAALEGMKIRKDRFSVLKEINIPVLMILGRKDTALDFDQLLQEAESARAEKIIFGDGHMSYIENEEALIEGLSKWAPIKKP